jgi:predicted amidophosphoribosyltransferase
MQMTPEDMSFLVGVVIFLIVIVIAAYILLQSRARSKGVAKAMAGPDQRICPRCDAIIPKNTEFCDNCGADLREDESDDGPKCPVCSAPLEKGSKKCVSCGHNLETPKPKEDFVCPKCGKAVDKDAKKCPSCKEEFWAPVRPPSNT